MPWCRISWSYEISNAVFLLLPYHVISRDFKNILPCTKPKSLRSLYDSTVDERFWCLNFIILSLAISIDNKVVNQSSIWLRKNNNTAQRTIGQTYLKYHFIFLLFLYWYKNKNIILFFPFTVCVFPETYCITPRDLIPITHKAYVH